MLAFTESVVEDAALAWLESAGWRVAHGPEIGPDMPKAERRDWGEAVLAQRLRDALARLNPVLPADALDDAFRKLTRSEGPTLEARNRAIHRSLVDGVTVEYRAGHGSIRGAQARVIDFNDPDENDWLAVNQYTVTENKHTRRPDVVLFINGLPLGIVPQPLTLYAPMYPGLKSSLRLAGHGPCASVCFSPDHAPRLILDEQLKRIGRDAGPHHLRRQCGRSPRTRPRPVSAS